MPIRQFKPVTKSAFDAFVAWNTKSATAETTKEEVSA
jgi:hypothetical protein